MPDDSPVVVGGLGGSGTRVIAQILVDLGYFIGSDMNRSLDNLWFTYLFNRPDWPGSTPDGTDEFRRAYDVFRRAMRDPGGVSLGDAGIVVDAARSHGVGTGISRGRSPRALWSAGRIRTLLLGGGRGAQIPRWGWKEPNSHVFLRTLALVEPNLKYIHVMRHGLDMAYSENQQQLKRWGRRYGVETRSNDGRGDPSAALDYWIAANRAAVEACASSGTSTAHFVDFDALCRDSVRQVTALVQYLGIEPRGGVAQFATTTAQQVIAPPSVGRHRDHDLSRFSSDQLAAVEGFGYTL